MLCLALLSFVAHSTATAFESSEGRLSGTDGPGSHFEDNTTEGPIQDVTTIAPTSSAEAAYGDAADAVMTSSGAQCTAIERGVWTNQPDFTEVMTKCAYTVLGDTVRTANCIQKTYPTISFPCLRCCGATSECARNKCMFQCFRNNGSNECRACVATNCQSAFLTCTGASSEAELPPVPADVVRPPLSRLDDSKDSDDDSDDSDDE